MLRRRGEPGTSARRSRRARRWALVSVAIVAVVLAVVLLRRPGDGHPLPEREQALDALVGIPLLPQEPPPLEAYRSIDIDPPVDYAAVIDRYPLTHVIDAPVELDVPGETADPVREPTGDGILDGDAWRLPTFWQVVLAAGVLAWVRRRLARPRVTEPGPQAESSSVAAAAMSSTCGSTADSSVGS